MDYLNDYLRAIPKADADAIRQSLKDNELHLGLDKVSEKEFERLILQIAEKNVALTELPQFGEQIESDSLNDFYVALGIDLNRLFSEQAAIETASVNYEHIYRSNLDEIRRAIESLETAISQLERQTKSGKGLVLRSYSFEPEKAKTQYEDYTEDTHYLFCDRDGSQLESAEINRLYHTYYLSLKQKESVDALHDSSGHTTATIKVLYETPGTLTNTNPEYDISKAIDGTSDTFWFNVCLKSNNGLDKISIGPERGQLL